MCYADQTNTKNRHVLTNHSEVSVSESYGFIVSFKDKEAKALINEIQLNSSKSEVMFTEKDIAPSASEPCNENLNESNIQPQGANETLNLLEDMNNKLHALAISVEKIQHNNNSNIHSISESEEVLEVANKWSNIQNIMQLVEAFPYFKLFFGETGQISVLRCEVCYNYLIRHKFSSNWKEDAVKGIGS